MNDAAIEYADDEIASIKELVHLYEAVGWVSYAVDPDGLARAIDRSTYVVTARAPDGTLIGLARCLSDDVSIMFVQDVLVQPDYQRQGIGDYLVRVCLSKFAHVTKKLLLSDNEPAMHEFYQSLGFSDLASPDAPDLVAHLHTSEPEPG